MLWKRFLRPESEPSEGGLIGYRQDLLFFLSIFTFYAAWLTLLDVVMRHSPTWAETAAILFGISLSVATFLLRRSWPRLACWLFVIGSFTWILLNYHVVKLAGSLALLALPVLLAGLLISGSAAIVTGCGAVLLLHQTWGEALAGASPVWLLFVVAAAGIGAVSDRGLRLIDLWEREATLHQRQMILQLRERQGELNRTLKALDEAYESLQRSRDELFQARQRADEARALKEQFVANVSHELRTPLNLMVGFAELMYLRPETYEGTGWTTDLVSDIREMYRAARHLQSLVDDILDLSRIDAARLPMLRELADVRPIIAEAVETIIPLARQRGLSLLVQDSPELPRLFVDRTRIRQVLLNLLSNAVRFTEQGGITVQMAERGSSVLISVSDTGAGISPDQLEHIFEKFRQANTGPRSRGGTGLGLALSRQFVELHGGRMWAQSEVGAGTTIFFSLPLPGTTPETAPLYHIPPHRQAERRDAPVVVVDPDPTIAEMLQRYLGDRRLLAATDTCEAEKRVAKEHPLAVIVNQMPAASAETWLGSLGEFSARCGVPILRCSIPSASWLQQSTGLDGCLSKPITRQMLAELCERQPQPRTILVVDDDPGFVSLMHRFLSTLDLSSEILKAYTGPHALQLAREKMPDLVLLDLLMPEMDGLAVLRAIRSDPVLQNTRVVGVTATSYGEEALRHYGTHLTLTRSLGLSPGTLTEILDAVLGIVRPDYTVATSD